MSTKRIFLLTFLITLGACLAGSLYLQFHHPKKAAPAVKQSQATDQPCTKEACIEITQEDGQKFKLNDFRFQPNHCIIFKTFPAGETRSTCGNYHLQWIGPDNMDQKRNTPIET